MSPSCLLINERAALERYLPDLSSALAERPLLDLERRGSDIAALFKQSGGPALTVPADLDGLGASALDSVRVQQAIAAKSPSLAAASSMHHLSIATLIEHSSTGTDAEKDLVKGVVSARMLLASGFSEGTPGGTAFRPTVLAIPTDRGFTVHGQKKPCSLARSMDLLTASVVEEDTGGQRRGVIVIPATTPGISVRRFWETDVLAASESDEVVLENVFVPSELVFWNDVDDPTGQHEKTAYMWFGLLTTATYLGAATALLERLLVSGKAEPESYVSAAAEIELATTAIEGIAQIFDAGDRSDDLSAKLLFCRQALKTNLPQNVVGLVGALGGINFIRQPEIAYLASVVNAIAFHPPSRKSAVEALLSFHSGEPLVLR
jgi:alkylation response protein AidB-like acyl-CoA dehydrogenase